MLLNSAGKQADGAVGVATDSQGNVFVAGTYLQAGDHLRTMTAKFDSAGRLRWVVKSTNRAWDDDQPIALAVDPNGDVVVAGSVWRGATKSDYLAIKYDGATGQQEWTGIYNGPSNGEEHPNSMALDDTGAVFLTGFTYTGEPGSARGHYEYVTVKFGNSGGLLWATQYPGVGNAIAEGLAVTSMGDVVVTGGVYNGSLESCHTFKYAGATGAELWHAVDQNAGGTAVAVDQTDQVFVGATSTSGATERDFLVFQHDGASGNRGWMHRYGSETNDQLRFMAVGPDGGVLVSGSTGNGIATLQLDPATGAVVWVQSHFALGHDVMVRDMKVTPSGLIVLTCRDDVNNQSLNAVTLSYDATTGRPGWLARYAGPSGGAASTVSIAIDVAENIYVVGGAQGDLGQDFLILKYAPEGTGLPLVGAPELTAKALTISQVQLDWVPSYQQPQAYEVERSDAGGAFNLVKAVTPQDSSAQDSGLVPGADYRYRIRARYADRSLISNEVRMKMPLAASGGKLSVPTKLSFGKLKAGTPKTKTLLLRNLSRDQSLRVQVLELHPSVYAIGGATDLTLDPRGSYRLPVTLNPIGPGNWNGSLTLQTSDPARLRVSISLTGAVR